MTTKAEKCRITKAVLLRSDASFKADFNGIELEGGTSGFVIRHFNHWVLVSNSKGEGWMPDMYAETIPEATTQKANEAASELKAKVAVPEAMLADKKQELEASENIHIQPKSLRQKSNTRQLLGKLFGRTFSCFDDSVVACQAVAVKDPPQDSDVPAMGA